MVLLTNKKAVGVFSGLLALIISLISASYFFALAQESTPTPAESGIALPIIMYHSILNDANRKGCYVITPQQLEADFEHIRTQGLTPVSAAQLIAFTNGESPLPENPILITFDDGYFNNYTYLWPLLQQFNFPAIINITGTYTEAYSLENKPGHNRYSHITWAQIKEMHDSGLVEFGNHTWDLHDRSRRRGILRRRNENIAEYERMLIEDITKLNDKLTELLGTPPQVFAFPFGNINSESQEIIARIGFPITLGCAEKVNRISTPETLLNLGRFNRSGTTTTQRFFSQFTK